MQPHEHGTDAVDHTVTPGRCPTTPTARSRRWLGQCEVCRAWGDARICNPCHTRFAPPVLRCRRCGLRLGTAPEGEGHAPICGACLLQPPPFARTVCAVDYGFPWDRLVAAFKFHGQPELATPLAHCLAAAVQAQQLATPALAWPQALLPVPLAPPRLAQRGYNQAWELARRLGRTLGLPARHDLLSRPLDTAQQAALGRAQRQHNLRSAFLVEPARRTRLQGLHVALVDDVMTTGATVGYAAAELLRAGARQVDVWVLARTPAPQPGAATAIAAAPGT